MAICFADDNLEKWVSADPRLRLRVSGLADAPVATIYTRTRGNVHALRDRITRRNVARFALDPDAVKIAIRALVRRGFEILYVGTFAIVARAPESVYENVLGLDFTIYSAIEGPPTWMRHLELRPTTLRKDALKPLPGVQHMTILGAATLDQDEQPPLLPGQLDLEGMLAALRVPATRAQNVRIALVDTGFDVLRLGLPAKEINYEIVQSLPGVVTDQDPAGHGTAMLAIACAIAPRATWLLSSMRPDEYSAFERVAARKPDVISCSWGWPENTAHERPHMRCAIYSALNAGIVVTFSGGNLGQRDDERRWTAGLRDVIAVGGAHDNQGTKRPSDLTSSYRSAVERGRDVPDLAGLSGCSPVPYIRVPVAQGSEFDEMSASSIASLDGDGTTGADGWAYSSQSSGATAMVAAIAGLVRAANPRLSNSAVKKILMETAEKIPRGPALAPMLPTGAGLVNARAAIEEAEARAARKGLVDLRRRPFYHRDTSD